jgi:hypothetical protein
VHFLNLPLARFPHHKTGWVSPFLLAKKNMDSIKRSINFGGKCNS